MSTTPQMPQGVPQDMSPDQYAELVDEARALVAAVERAVRRTGAVFAATSAVTIAAMALDQPVVAQITAVAAVAAFLITVVLLCLRIILGQAPEPVAGHPRDAVSGAPEEVAQVAHRPATGSGPATATNRRILRK